MGEVIPLRPGIACTADAEAVERMALNVASLARAGAITGMAFVLTHQGQVQSEELVGDLCRNPDLAFAATSRLKQRVRWPE